MGNCQYCHVHRTSTPSKEINTSMQVSHVHETRVPWCAHKHSPALRDHIGAIGSATRLRCEGDLDKCQVPKDLFADDQ
jgi:hypothetical protein